jgi:hypothetical protein
MLADKLVSRRRAVQPTKGFAATVPADILDLFHLPVFGACFSGQFSQLVFLAC